MDIQRMEEFSVLVQQGSFRLAAHSLGISPALLSNHISLLEKRAGVKLLERNAHSLRLTEAGKRICQDGGQGNIALKVELCGRVMILCAALPAVREVLRSVGTVLAELSL